MTSADRARGDVGGRELRVLEHAVLAHVVLEGGVLGPEAPGADLVGRLERQRDHPGHRQQRVHDDEIRRADRDDARARAREAYLFT